MRAAPPDTTARGGRYVPPPNPWSGWFTRPGWNRAWAFSFLLHLTTLAVIALITAPRPRGTSLDGLRITMSLSEAASTEEGFYDDEVEEGEEAGESFVAVAENPSEAVAANGASSAGGSPFDVPTPTDPHGALPAQPGTDLGGAAAQAAGQGLTQMMAGKSGGPMPKGGKARTGVFGLQGEGYKFVYVFDHSGSMGGGGRSPLAAAKAELKRSLADLKEVHQFQIIFYNDRTTVFPLAGHADKLVLGTTPNKERATRFIDGILADGGTRHEPALLEALRYGADVIFFLTDADQPELSSAELERIRRRNQGTVIHTIEFGLGPQLDRQNFLVRLAHQNGGQHVYVDVPRLTAAR